MERSALTELPGTQLVRLVDVFALGPAMIWAGTKTSKKNEVLSLFLIISGAATMVFNGINFVRRVE